MVLCKKTTYDSSMILIRSRYVAATVKLQSMITLTYTSLMVNFPATYIATYIYVHALTSATHENILAGLDSSTRSKFKNFLVTRVPHGLLHVSYIIVQWKTFY